jgi:oligopeptide/dipeptide ABC transporter ATP-binding protein
MNDPSAPALEVQNLVKHYRLGAGLSSGGRGVVHAVDDVSFTLNRGEILGLVGESGSGKTTVAKSILRLVEPTSGTIRLGGTNITHLTRKQMRPLRRDLNIVFQDPYSSLNPQMTCGDIIAEPLRLHHIARGKAADARVEEMLDTVGLHGNLRYRFPHELSGGQRQRIGIARALITQPSVLVADEPVSALDVSVQASILNLLRDLQRNLGFSCLLIAHHLGTVEYLCDRVSVIHLGKIVESGTSADLFGDAQHPYTKALLAAAVVPDPVAQRERRGGALDGDPPSPIDPPSGCRFRTRCPLVSQCPRSGDEEPPLGETVAGHRVACHLVDTTHAAPPLELSKPWG